MTNHKKKPKTIETQILTLKKSLVFSKTIVSLKSVFKGRTITRQPQNQSFFQEIYFPQHQNILFAKE
jgi:hypothetical protein